MASLSSEGRGEQYLWASHQLEQLQFASTQQQQRQPVSQCSPALRPDALSSGLGASSCRDALSGAGRSSFESTRPSSQSVSTGADTVSSNSSSSNAAVSCGVNVRAYPWSEEQGALRTAGEGIDELSSPLLGSAGEMVGRTPFPVPNDATVFQMEDELI